MFDFAIILLLWSLGLTILYYRLSRKLKDSPATLRKDILKRVEALGMDIENLQEEISGIKNADLKHLQRVGFLRFNPFSETGGNQSFALALTDDDGNGVVISSLHGREATRVYGKPVKSWGENGFEFSEEERKAVELAKNG
jgi:hypothetical protein